MRKWFNMKHAMLMLVALVLVDLLFFNPDALGGMLFSSLFLFIGWSQLKKTKGKGKVFSVIGIILAVTTLFQLYTFRLALVVGLIMLGVRLLSKPQSRKKIDLTFVESTPYKTPADPYAWRDLNIQRTIGDVDLDLTNTMLPKGDSIAVVNVDIGNIRVFVPYDVELSIIHRGNIGAVNIFDEHHTMLGVVLVDHETPGFQEAEQRFRLYTNIRVGELQVTRV